MPSRNSPWALDPNPAGTLTFTQVQQACDNATIHVGQSQQAADLKLAVVSAPTCFLTCIIYIKPQVTPLPRFLLSPS
jgi:hypothetical protein